PAFWDDQEAAQSVISETNQLKHLVGGFKQIVETVEDLEVTYELVKEENDQELFQELKEEMIQFRKVVNDFELQMLLSEPYDANNAILDLHPGAGGTESQDCGSIMLRMYQRWSEDKKFTVQTLDYLPGCEAY